MNGGNAVNESKDVGNEPAAAVRKVMAPPKTSPPEAKSDGAADAKNDDSSGADPGKKKKKALPPPANPPPQGSTSAAAAFRAKSTLPPPNGPPPGGATASASVAKVRGAARPPSTAPPPSGGQQAKPIGPPPSGPPPKAAGVPSTTPPSDPQPAISAGDRADTASGEFSRRAEAKGMTPAVSENTVLSPSYSEVAESKPQRSTSLSTQSAAKGAVSVDLLGDESPIVRNNSYGTAAPSVESSAPTLAKMPIPATKPPSQTQRPQMVHSVTSEQDSPSAYKPPVVKKSTIEVLNDTTASLSTRRSSLLDSNEQKQTDIPNEDSAGGSSNTVKKGRAAPFSGITRLNAPEEEIIMVKKQEVKKSDDDEPPTMQGNRREDAKQRKETQSHGHFDDELDDVEEIPFLEETKAEPKQGEEDVDIEPDDPIVTVESKHGPLKSGGNRSSSSLHGEAKGETEHKHSHYEDKENNKEPLDIRREKVAQEDVYSELRKMKRAMPANDGEGYSSTHQSDSSENMNTSRSGKERKDSNEDDGGYSGSNNANGGNSNSREKSREKRREKRRNKHEEEVVKKIQAQFFNPKSVPYVPDHLLDFVKRPLECGRGHILKCFIERNESNKLAPVYTLLLEVNSSSGRPIMYARKSPSSRITSHYVISLNKDDLFLSRGMRSHQYIGKLRSSTNLMEYSLYDQGDNPEDLDSDCEVDDDLRKTIRAELAFIRYHNTKKSYARKMEVVLPAIVDNGTAYLDWRPLSRDQMMEEHVRTIAAAGCQNIMDTSNFIFMHKRETKYDPLSSCIVDFRSRATCVSVKNFQLVHSEPTDEAMKEKYRKLYPEYVYEDQGTVSLPQEHVLLQLGKVGKDCFNMDFQYPLSMLQAFAVSLSRFDTKQR